MFFTFLAVIGPVLGVLTALSIEGGAMHKGPSGNLGDLEDQDYSFLRYYRIYLVTMSVATLITILILTIRLLSHATSKKLRVIVLKRYAFYTFCYFMMVFDQLFDNFPELFGLTN